MKTHISTVKLSILVPAALLSGFFLIGSTAAMADSSSVTSNRANSEKHEKNENTRKYDEQNDSGEDRRGIEDTVIPETDSNSTNQQNQNLHNPSEQPPAEIMPGRN